MGSVQHGTSGALRDRRVDCGGSGGGSSGIGALAQVNRCFWRVEVILTFLQVLNLACGVLRSDEAAVQAANLVALGYHHR